MNVYIEYVIIDNLTLTYCICALSHRLTRTAGRFWRDAVTAAGATAVAIFYPFIPNAYWTLAVKLALCAAMTLTCYPPKKFLRGALGILAATFLLGGAVFAVGYIRYGNVTMALTLPAAEFPLGLVVLAGLLVFLLLRKLVVRRHKLADCADLTGRMEVEYNGAVVTCTAFLDSGNRVYDSRSGLPVIVMGMRVGLKLLSDDEITKIMMGKPIAGTRFERVQGLSKQSKILIVKPQKVTLYVRDKENIIDNVMLGLSFSRFHDAEEYDAILNPAIIPEVLSC